MNKPFVHFLQFIVVLFAGRQAAEAATTTPNRKFSKSILSTELQKAVDCFEKLDSVEFQTCVRALPWDNIPPSTKICASKPVTGGTWAPDSSMIAEADSCQWTDFAKLTCNSGYTKKGSGSSAYCEFNQIVQTNSDSYGATATTVCTNKSITGGTWAPNSSTVTGTTVCQWTDFAKLTCNSGYTKKGSGSSAYCEFNQVTTNTSSGGYF